MNDTLKAIVKVLTEGKPDRQVAAAQILAELKPSEPAVVKALATRLHGADPLLARYILEALAAIGTEDSARALLERLRSGGAESEQIAVLMSRSEQGGSAKFLAAVFDDADLELRCRILSILGKQVSKESLAVLRKALLSPEASLAEAAMRTLTEIVGRLPGERRAALVEQLKKDAEVKHEVPGPLAHALRALGLLDAAGSKALLLKFASGKHAPQVRQAAIAALDPADLTPAQAESLVAHLTEPDMTYVVRPTIALLLKVEKFGGQIGVKLKKLLEVDNQEVQAFALHAMRHVKTEAMAQTCIEHLQGGVEGLHDAAADALANNPAAVDPLLHVFLKEKDAAVARRLAGPLAKLGASFAETHVKTLVERAAKQVAGHDPLGDITLSTVLAAAREPALADLADRALKLRRAKKYGEAQALLVRAATHAPLDAEAQFQLALCKLLAESAARENGVAAPSATGGNAMMGYFASLLRDNFPLADRLKKDPQVVAEHLLRVGSHFAEGVGPERRLGAELLQFVATKHAKQKAGEQAKVVLRAENL